MQANFQLKTGLNTSALKVATKQDESVVVNILCQSFKSDPLISWMLGKSRNPDKLKILMTYLFRQALKIGEIFLTQDKTATAIWKSDLKEKLSWEFIYRNISFLFQIGVKSVIRMLSSESFTYKQFPKYTQYRHLVLLAVLPENRGKGLASDLMNPLLNEMKSTEKPVYLETANCTNVKIYTKKGFSIYNIWQKIGIKVYYLKRV